MDSWAMYTKLNQAIALLSADDYAILNEPSEWGSIIINRRKPHTYRVFKVFSGGDLDGYRVCLHRFSACSEEDAIMHPHAWPSAMSILSGRYRMRTGLSPNPKAKPTLALDQVLGKSCDYVMTNPLTWHSVQPLCESWSIMINGPRYQPELAHAEIRTTVGKGLDAMTEKDKERHLRRIETLMMEM